MVIFRADGVDREVRDQRQGLDVASGQEAAGANGSGDERRLGN